MNRTKFFSLLGAGIVSIGAVAAAYFYTNHSSANLATTHRPITPVKSIQARKPPKQQFTIPDDSSTVVDTLHLPNGIVAPLTLISQKIFEEAPAGPKRISANAPDSTAGAQLEQKHIAPEAARVQRQGDKLILRPAHGQPVVLVDSPPLTDEPTSYVYLTSLPDIQHWLVEMWRYGEERYYLLVNQRTGDRDTLVEYPVMSPDRQLLACGVATGEYVSYGRTALELWKIDERGEVVREWYRETKGIGEVRWRDDHTLLLQQEAIGPTGKGWHKTEDDISRRYVQLRLPQ